MLFLLDSSPNFDDALSLSDLSFMSHVLSLLSSSLTSDCLLAFVWYRGVPRYPYALPGEQLLRLLLVLPKS
jgi:hypothetical protein